MPDISSQFADLEDGASSVGIPDGFKGKFQKLIETQADEAAFGHAKDSAIVQLVDLLLNHGYESKASDIHIEPERDYVRVRFRIDGVLHDIAAIPKHIHDLVITRIKIMAKLRTDEHQIPQDGKLQCQFKDELVDIRVSIIPTIRGENAVMRLLAEQGRRFRLEFLGLSDRDLKILMKYVRKPWGMLLSTGPTGSGKTTTLYTILEILNQREVNVITIEDPVEYNIPGITQIQVNPKARLTFAAGLRSIVRQDPNIIMVGEIRDEETAEIAVNSAMTGHLVLSTMHTNDAATTLPRFLEMGVKPFLVASTINVAIGQRLVRTICKNCREDYEADRTQLSDKIPEFVLKKLAGDLPKIKFSKGKGCGKCQYTGYLGRIGVFEVLEMTDDIRALIMKNADASMIHEQAVKDGMTTMFDDALAKVKSGITTIEEMLRVINI